jgi:hypothetical protein
MTISSGLLSVCPRVHKDHGRLIAQTAWRVRLLFLGCLYREVTVDPKAEEVILRRRYFWLLSSRRRIRFRDIEAVTYSYQDWAAGASWSWAHDSVDLYSVGLHLRGGEELRLFYFYGDGTFTNDGPLPDWLYWEEYLCDMSGTQQKESRAFVELLRKMIGVTVVPGRA